MGILHSFHKWVASTPEVGPVGIPLEVREEIFLVGVSLATAEVCLRWEPSTTLVATDATPIASGSAEAEVSPALMQGLLRQSMHVVAVEEASRAASGQ